jgi:hypothetical protein
MVRPRRQVRRRSLLDRGSLTGGRAMIVLAWITRGPVLAFHAARGTAIL